MKQETTQYIKKEPRVLMFVPKYPYPVAGGLEKQAHLLAKELKNQRVQVFVISGKFDKRQLSSEEIEGIKVFRFEFISNRILRFLITPFLILSLLFENRKNFDVLHVHQTSWMGLFTVMMGKLFNKKVITKLPNVGDWGVPGIAKSKFGKFKIDLLKKSDAIVAMTFQSLKELMDIDYPLEQVLCTPNGIEANEFEQKKDNEKSCKVGFVGRLEIEKNLFFLLKVWKQINEDKNLNTSLHIYGDGSMMSEIKNFCLKNDLSNTVVFHGYANDLDKVYSNIDIFINTSYVEGNSNSILEAMMYGIPVICTNVGGSNIQLGPEGAINIYKVDDVSSMTKGLKFLINNSSKRLEIGNLMRNRIDNYFIISRIANTYLNAYYCMLDGKLGTINMQSNEIYSKELLKYKK